MSTRMAKKGSELLVEHLLFNGHERIGLINWHPGILVGDAREAGYRSAMQEVGIPVEADWTGYDDDSTADFLGITSVRQPIDEVATALFTILLGEIDHEPRPRRQVVFEPELVIRRSSVSPQ